VAELKRLVDDASLLLSVAITSSNPCVLTTYQMSMAIKAAYPPTSSATSSCCR